MEHVYKQMLKDLLKKRHKNIKQNMSQRGGTLKDLGQMELLEELNDYLGYGDIEDETPTPDQIMVNLYKLDH